MKLTQLDKQETPWQRKMDRWEAIRAGRVTGPNGDDTFTTGVPRWLRKTTAEAVHGSDADAYPGEVIGGVSVPGLDWDKLVRRHRRSIRPADDGQGSDRWPSWEQMCAAWHLIRSAYPTTGVFHVQLLVTHRRHIEVGWLGFDIPGIPSDELYLAVNDALQTGCELDWPETRLDNSALASSDWHTKYTEWRVTGCRGIASHWHDGLLAEWLKEADEARERKKHEPPRAAPQIPDEPPF